MDAGRSQQVNETGVEKTSPNGSEEADSSRTKKSGDKSAVSSTLNRMLLAQRPKSVIQRESVMIGDFVSLRGRWRSIPTFSM